MQQTSSKHRRPSKRYKVNNRKRKKTRSQTFDKKVRVEVSKDYPWKLLDRLTTDLTQWLSDAERTEVKGIVRSRNFTRYSELTQRWGLQSINSSPELPGPAMASKLLLSAVIRKYQFEGTDTKKRDVALQNVVLTNRTCSCFNRQGWKRLFVDNNETLELQLMKKFVEKVIGPLLPDRSRLTEWSRHGPGSDTVSSLGRNSTYDKYKGWPYHVTASAKESARRFISDDERWLGALEESYRRKYHIKPWEILNWETFWDTVLVVSQHNKVTTVPKDGSKDRPIAIENRLNVMLQLGVDGFIRRRLKRFGINLNSQEMNQMLAYQGSIRSDADSPVTIDLSNASDTISLRLVKLLFPKAWFQYLCELRSPYGKFPDGSRLRYSKLSSMGNGYTFAIETLIFCAICYAAIRVSGLTWKGSDIAVYGDDMILPQSASAPLMNLLVACGLEPNQDKSFLSGRVRESCGSDWVSGVNMRPIFIKEVPTTICDLYTSRNLLFRWAKLHLASELVETEKYFKTLIPSSLWMTGPLSDEEFSSYIHSPEPHGWLSTSVNKLTAWSYHFEYVSCRSRRLSGNDFLFRKLMHDLRPTGEIENNWCKRKLNSGGSRFEISKRDFVKYSKCIRTSPDWRAEYSRVYDWQNPTARSGTPS